MQGFQGVLANEMYEVFAKTVDLGSLDAPDMQALAELVLADPPERQYGVEAGVVRVPRFHALDTCVSFVWSLGADVYVAWCLSEGISDCSTSHYIPRHDNRTAARAQLVAADSKEFTFYADMDKLPTPGKIGVFFRLQPSEPPKARVLSLLSCVVCLGLKMSFA